MKWFRKEKEAGRLFYSTDLHSHILPGIDDGSPDVDTSIQLLRAMQSWGIKHIFATPHIIDDVYENSPATIEPACQALKAKMAQEGIDMEVAILGRVPHGRTFQGIAPVRHSSSDTTAGATAAGRKLVSASPHRSRRDTLPADARRHPAHSGPPRTIPIFPRKQRDIPSPPQQRLPFPGEPSLFGRLLR